MMEREGGHRLPSQSILSAFSVWNGGQSPTGALERHDSSHSVSGGRTHIQKGKFQVPNEKC